MLRPVAYKACQPKHSEHRQPKPTPHKRTQLTLDHTSVRCVAASLSRATTLHVCVFCSVCAAAIAQHETWLNRNRYLIVAAFRGISATNKRSTVNKSRGKALLASTPPKLQTKQPIVLLRVIRVVGRLSQQERPQFELQTTNKQTKTTHDHQSHCSMR